MAGRQPREGDERLSVSDKAGPHKGERSSVSGQRKDAAPGRKAAPADVGRALRSIYDDTLREDIPADLKDLLGRLG